MKDKDSFCITDKKKIIYGFSFGVMTFDLDQRYLDPWSKVKNAIFANISKTTGDSLYL